MVEGIPSTWVPSYAQGLSILLVDHDKTSLNYLGSMLEQYSYKVTFAALAIDALAMLQQEKGKFKLVMASVNIPDMDTISFLRQLLRNELPVILIAPERSVPAAIKALGEGASLYLDKPISMDDLKYIWQHVFTNKRKRLIDDHGDPNNGENPRIAKTSKRSIIKDMLNNASTAAATRDKIKHYISLNKCKGLERTEAPVRHETTACYSDLKGKGKLVVEDEINKKDSRTSSTEISMDICCENNISNGSSAKENIGNNIQGESTDNDSFKNKPRVVWSPELHLKFISVVSRLGDKKASPKYILEAMNVPGLTHRQIGSYLQKFKAQVDRIFKASQCMDAETSTYNSSRFLNVSEILERSNQLLGALDKRSSILVTIPKEKQHKDQQTDDLPSTETINGIHAAPGKISSGNAPNATNSPTLKDINQSPAVEAFPTIYKVPDEDNFLRVFRDIDLELDMGALEAFYNSTSGHMNNADESLESFGEVSAMANLNLSLGTKPNDENEPDDYLIDSCDKNPESDAMEVTYNLDFPSTGKQPMSDFTEMLNAMDEEAQGLEGQATGPTQGDVDRYCDLLANVLIDSDESLVNEDAGFSI